jgi:FixJ family two-component response regulator
VDYFLLAIDCARQLLEGQHSKFDYELFDQLEKKDVKSESLKKTEEKKESVLARKEKNLNKKKGRVIVIDDEAFICEELCDMLNEFGFNASSFTNPVEALAEIVKEKPDLICTDLKMPEMSGMELLKKVRGLKIECPIIFITGFIDNGLLIEGLDQGASGFLEKPFEQHEVVSLAIQSVERFRTRKLLNRSINYIIYQFNDLDNYLKKEGKESLRKSFKLEIETLLTLRRESNS